MGIGSMTAPLRAAVRGRQSQNNKNEMRAKHVHDVASITRRSSALQTSSLHRHRAPRSAPARRSNFLDLAPHDPRLRFGLGARRTRVAIRHYFSYDCPCMGKVWARTSAFAQGMILSTGTAPSSSGPPDAGIGHRVRLRDFPRRRATAHATAPETHARYTRLPVPPVGACQTLRGCIRRDDNRQTAACCPFPASRG